MAQGQSVAAAPGSRLLALVRPLARALHWAGAAALAAMMLITVADVVLRSFRNPILGTYELVGFLGAFAIGFALPQTSLDRGQVLMDFLARHLPASANRLLSVFTRAIGIGLFAVLAWHLATMGADQRRTGDVTPLLSLPLSWPAFGVAAACVVECFVLAATALPERGEGGGSGGTP